VHVLLSGPYGCAKSLFLEELERLPGAVPCSGATTTRAGIVDAVLRDSTIRYLLMDEGDRCGGEDLAALNRLMAQQRMDRLQYGRRDNERREVWVFMTANEPRRIPRATYDRFVHVEFAPYDTEEFRRVALRVLVQREGCDPELAAEIAQTVTHRTGSVRRAVDIYRLSGGDRRRVPQLAEDVLGR
jgi:MoxR-like ATPase